MVYWAHETNLRAFRHPLPQDAKASNNHWKPTLMYDGTDEHGNRVTFSEAQVLAVVLEQFYRTTQVMIGEAISLSELKAFLASKETELR